MARSIRVGSIELKLVSDGWLKSSIDLVLDFDRSKAQALAGAEPDGSVYIPVNNFLWERDGAVVLVDVGAGDTMQPTLGALPTQLSAAGHPPESVTHILLTHLHPDHANGLVDSEGAALYPAAEIFVHAAEHDFWMGAGSAGEPEGIKRQRARNQVNLAPYATRVRRMRDGEEVLGCAPILAPGHTPGHTCWRIDAGSQQLLAWGDIAHFASVQIPHPEVALTYDLDKELAKLSRLRVLEMAASEGLLIAGAHLDAPGLGYVRRHGVTFALEPAP